MSQPAPPTRLFAAKTACVIGVALLAAYLLVALVARHDRLGRAELETFTTPTALGDTVVFEVTDRVLPREVVLNFENTPLYATGFRNEDDWEVRKVATDDAGRYSLYRRYHHRRKTFEDELLVKVAPGRYLVLSPTLPPAPSASSTPAPSPEPGESDTEAGLEGNTPEAPSETVPVVPTVPTAP